MAHGIALRFNQTEYTADDERALAGILAAGSGPVNARPGVRPGSGDLLSVGGTPETVTINPHVGIITDPAGGGSYPYVIPSAVTLALPARPGAGATRIHEVIARIRNVDVRAADATREPELYVASGAESSSPAAPTIPAGQLGLGRLTAPSSGAIALSNPPQRTVAAGGVVPVANATQRNALTVYDGLVVYREDTDVYEARINAAWGRLLTTADVTVDTGWVDIPLATGFAPAPDNIPQRRQIGPVMYFRGAVQRTSGNFTAGANHFISLASIPAAQRPGRLQNDSFSTLVATSGATGYRGAVTPAGDVVVFAGPSAVATVYLKGLSGYTVD